MNRSKEYGLFKTLNLFDYYNRKMQSIVLNLIEWKNLPDMLTSNLIEEYLFNNGECVFLCDETLGYNVLTFYSLTENLWIKQPREIVATCENGWQKRLENNVNCKIIQNTFNNLSSKKLVADYALQFEELKNAQLLNINSQKTPLIGSVPSRKMKLSVENLLNQHKTNTPYILIDNGLELGDVLSVLDLKSPYLADKFQILIQNLWNEFLTHFGVQNNNISKKERLVAGEIEENNSQIQIYRDVFLTPRKEACKIINKLFNLNIEVEYKHPLIMNDNFTFINDEGFLNE